MIKKEFIARVCHETNKAYCEALGDTSQGCYDSTPQWQKDSIMKGVELHCNGDITPGDSHESWLDEKATAGWKYGKVKDVGRKEHPCFVAFEDLPKEQQAKDYIFKAIVDSLKPLLRD